MLSNKSLKKEFFNAIQTENIKRFQTLLTPELVNIQDNKKMTPLLLSAKSHQKLEIISKLIISGADLTKSDKSLQSPLLITLRYNKNKKIIKLFLKQKNIDINKSNIYKETPLMYAIKNFDLEIIDLFLKEKKIEINSEDLHGENALFYALKYNDDENVVFRLVEEGIRIGCCDNKGFSALMYAISYKKNYKVKLLG